MQYKNISLLTATGCNLTSDRLGPRPTHRRLNASLGMSAEPAKRHTIWNVLGRTVVLAVAAVSMSAIVTLPAEAAPIKVFPGDISSNPAAVTGIVGDGTLNNDSWHVTTGPSNTFDFFWLSDVPGLVNPGVTIRDIVRMSFDVKRSGSYLDDTFTLQIETKRPSPPGGSQAIDFALNQRGDTGVDDSADFQLGRWNTYEWNQNGDAGTGLEGTMHQNESGPSNGGNGQNNPWLTLKETLDKDTQNQTDGNSSTTEYYSWLDEPIDGFKIAARDVGSDEFDSWIDNFVFTYNTDNGEQTAVVDFAAERVSVPEPATLGMALFGLVLLGMGLGARQYRS